MFLKGISYESLRFYFHLQPLSVDRQKYHLQANMPPLMSKQFSSKWYVRSRLSSSTIIHWLVWKFFCFFAFKFKLTNCPLCLGVTLSLKASCAAGVQYGPLLLPESGCGAGRVSRGRTSGLYVRSSTERSTVCTFFSFFLMQKPFLSENNGRALLPLLGACYSAIWQLPRLLVGLGDIFQKQVGEVANSHGLQVSLPGLKAQLCHAPALWPWVVRLDPSVKWD